MSRAIPRILNLLHWLVTGLSTSAMQVGHGSVVKVWKQGGDPSPGNGMGNGKGESPDRSDMLALSYSFENRSPNCEFLIEITGTMIGSRG